MAESVQDNQPTSQPDPMADFGANEWLVDEMYERYQRTPTASTGPGGSSSSRGVSRAPTSPAAPTRRPPGRPPHASRPRRPPQKPETKPQPSKPEPKPRPRTTKPAAKAPAKPESKDGEPKESRTRRTRRPRHRQAGQPAGPQGEGPGGPGRGQRRAEAEHRCAAPGAHRPEHGHQPDGADRDERAHGPGQAAVGQPHRHQQPPRPGPRRQGVLHPPHRLRAGEGAQGHAGDEQRLRRRRRQAEPHPARAHQPRPRDRPAEVRRHPAAAGAVDQGRREHGLRRVLDRLRGPGPQGPRRQARGLGLPGHHDQPDQPGHHRHQPLRCRG